MARDCGAARQARGAQTIGSNTAPGQTESYKLTVNSQLVVENRGGEGQEGQFHQGLTAKDFTVTEDGVPQTIKFCEHQESAEDSEPLPPRRRTTRTITIYKTLDRTQIAPESPGDTQYKDRRLLALYFDMTAMPPQDQMRALAAAENICPHADDRGRPGRHPAIQRVAPSMCCRTSPPTAIAC